MRRPRSLRRDEGGLALIVAVVATMVVGALGTALVLLTATETLIASHFRDALEAFYAAEGALERVLPELETAADFDELLAGAVRSRLVDGAPGGTRDLGAGTVLDLAQATHMVRCARTAACSDAVMDAVSDERPWGHNNPRWQLYAYGRMHEVFGTPDVRSRLYVVVWVGDDPFEVDADPLHDGALESTPGHGQLALRAHAYGPDGALRAVEAIVARRDGRPRFVSWREVR